MSHDNCELSIELSCPGEPDAVLFKLERPLKGGSSAKASHGPFSAQMRITEKAPYSLIEVEVSASKPQRCYLSLKGSYKKGEIFAFSGPKEGVEIFRQSPHDPADHSLNMAKEAVPMLALKDGAETLVALSDQPGHCDNYTTQSIDSAAKSFKVSSGDPGGTPGFKGKSFEPYFHEVSPTKSHVFRLAVFSSQANSLAQLRKDVFYCVDALWGEAGSSKYRAICFASNYMHYRRNETGFSQFWVTPGIEYANKQYTRDAFWQSMILPLQMEQQCYDAVYPERYKYAECALMFLIWSLRLKRRGGKLDPVRAADALSYVEERCENGRYYATNQNGGYDFKSWYDICAFEHDDVIAYNQGLLAVALKAAQELGLNPKTPFQKAEEAYNGLYIEDKGFFPLSLKKRGLCVDALVGDLLSFLLFGKGILDSAKVLSHYKTVCSRARTEYGIKVTAAENGGFAPLEFYGANGYVFEGFKSHKPGYYQWGGSWHLYEMLFHIDAHLHKAAEAEDMLIWRAAIDFKTGGTYHEFIDTVTGEGVKANQGWNAAVYAIWKILIDRGLAGTRFFDETDKIL